MGKADLYDYPKKLEQAVEKLREEKGICRENVDSIIAFSKVKLAKGISPGRAAKTVYVLRFLAKWLKMPFMQATKDDILTLVGYLEGSDYAEHTKHDFRVILKMFYKWLKGNDEFFPPEVAWLKKSTKNFSHKLPEELLSEEDVLKMAEAAGNLRDKALILTLYETGCRIGELMSLQMKNVNFDQYGAVLRVTGKTGDRRVRIISSARILASWIDLHPKSKDPDAWLWFSQLKKKHNGTCLRHGTIYSTIKKIAQAAGIRKSVYPHLFRHSRATALASKLTEAQMKEHFGWVQGSDMAATYVHLSGRDVDNALLQLYSLKEKSVEKEKLDIRICLRCKERNSPAQSFCGKCGNPLDEKTLLVDHRLEFIIELMKDKEAREFLARKAVSLGLDATVLGG